MWKWIAGPFAGLLVLLVGLGAYLNDKLYLRFDHATVSPSDFDRRFQPRALRADFVYLTTTIERLHPNFSAIVDRQSYGSRKASILAALDRPMTRLEFFRLAATINGEFRDGHTELLAPREEWDAFKASSAGAPPLVIRFDEGGAVFSKALGIPIAAGSRLRAINGVETSALRERYTGRTSGEGLSFRWADASRQFPRETWEEGLRPPYHLAWTAPDGTLRDAAANGVAFKTWDQARGTLGAATFHLNIETGVAHLVVSSLDAPPAEFKAFLKSAFTQIRDKRVAVVVLDLRQNTGGDSRQGDLLQSYLSDDTLPALSRVSVRTSPEVKAAYRTLLPPGFRWIPLNAVVPMLRGIQGGPDGGFYVFDPDGAAPRRRMFTNGLAFKGELYVLIGPVTYSSAVIFAAPLKYWKRAIFVGEAAGEPLTFYGDNYEFDLPNTKLQASVSHKAFTLLGSTGSRSWLQPDIAVRPGEDAYQIALRDIASRRGAARS